MANVLLKIMMGYEARLPEDPETGMFECVIGIEPCERVNIPKDYQIRELLGSNL
ncbi:hypothetical protein M3N64_08505 [Sporolactobacillus sp. CPB3-1]|uniref:Uncharacterized protein n=1 Tax=Sporolactobacillus mangiferae TaxID=2940498 RepID=A0ABT0MBC8_9BACL|nr:hypothetical protein [Sporolactobacillus mangiferae]MCL1631988.1 hypothetical protein [Sporolactobacillus mangiferae]